MGQKGGVRSRLEVIQKAKVHAESEPDQHVSTFSRPALTLPIIWKQELACNFNKAHRYLSINHKPDKNSIARRQRHLYIIPAVPPQKKATNSSNKSIISISPRRGASRRSTDIMNRVNCIPVSLSAQYNITKCGGTTMRGVGIDK